MTVAVVTAMLTGLLAAAVTARKATQTTWDGVYTPQQAARGDPLYIRTCSHCHQSDLSGGADGAPELRGAAFLSRWRNRSLWDFYRLITDTMPDDAPGSLTRQQTIDVVAFLLRKNLMPAGSDELPADRETLERIAVAEQPPRP